MTDHGPQKQPFVCILHEFWSYEFDHCPTCFIERSFGVPGNILEMEEANYSSAKHDAEQFARIHSPPTKADQ